MDEWERNLLLSALESHEDAGDGSAFYEAMESEFDELDKYDRELEAEGWRDYEW